MHNFYRIPEVIQAEVIALQKEMRWPEYVPSYAELPTGMFKSWDTLDVADCEQLVAHHSRLGREAIERYQKTNDPTDKRKLRYRAARNVLWARLYRCRYFTILGQDGSEADMPFPCLSDEEIKKLDKEESEG